MSNKAIKYRVYPTKDQCTMFAKTFGCCRKVYNLMLAYKIEGYKATGKFPNVTPAMFKEDYPYLKDVDSLALANKQIDLQAAFRNHFSKSRKRKNKFPKFKSAKRSRKSYTTNNQHGTVAIIGNAIKLPKIGLVKAVIHRLPEEDWILKTATVSQDSDGKYYISLDFQYEKPVCNVEIDISNSIGLDYSSDGLFTDNNGNKGSNHKYYCESQEKLAKEQHNLSRKVGNEKDSEKSNNYLKQLKKVNKIHKKIANQRMDFLHKLSTEIANRYDIVCVETLDMSAIANVSFGNGKATFDNGYGMFLKMLEYKLADRGKILIKVDKWYPSSQICNSCGAIHPEMKDLKIRVIRCNCGHEMDRDQNAANNILQEGLRILQETA